MRQSAASVRRLRVVAILSLAMVVALAFGVGTPRSDVRKDATKDKVPALIRQLGHDNFADREAASVELETIGEPALSALRKAAASDDDPEIRWRAEQIIQSVGERIRVAAARKELARWQGEWAGELGQWLTIEGDQWASGTPTFGPVSGTLQVIAVREEATLIDMVVESGPTQGRKCHAIYRLDNGTLHYCGTYDAVRPTDFDPAPNEIYIAFQRGVRGAAVVAQPPPPAEVQLESDDFCTDLPLAETRDPVHRVVLKARLAEGAGALTLESGVPRFDEFGHPAAGGQPPNVATFDCTLTLVKNENEQQRYELRGPKIVSRLSLVTCRDIAAWGGRLLVHGNDGAVRYVINLDVHEERFPPCHPGCFPAGTLVHVPDGTQRIERIREGDLVTSLDADRRPSHARVTGVFVTRNRLLAVRVDGGALVTTETQPISLAAGGFRPAGELKAGDRVWRWVDGERESAAVLDVSPAEREAEVFNLVLGETRAFIAGDFVVRSKPPPVLP